MHGTACHEKQVKYDRDEGGSRVCELQSIEVHDDLSSSDFHIDIRSFP